MKELIDKLWEAIATAGSTVVTPAPEAVLAIASSNLLVDKPGESLTYYLPDRQLEGSVPAVIDITVDFNFTKTTDKDIQKNIYIATKDGTLIHCPSGSGEKVRLPMVSDYRAFFDGTTGWRINDAVIDGPAPLTIDGYLVDWKGGANPTIVDQYQNYYLDPTKLILMDNLTPSYNPDQYRFYLSIDSETEYSTEDEANSGGVFPTVGRTIVNDGRNWEIVEAWPYLFPHGTPGVDLLAIAAYAGEGYKVKLFRMTSYNVAGLPDPAPAADFTTLAPIAFFTVIDGGTRLFLMERSQTADSFKIRYSDYEVNDDQGLSYTKEFVIPGISGRYNYQQVTSDLALPGCFVAFTTDDFLVGKHLVFGFVKNTEIVNSSGDVTTVLAGEGFQHTLTTLPNWSGSGFRWYISGYDAYNGLVWLNRRNTDPTISRDQTLLYCFNRHTQTLTEVITRTANDPVTFDHERFVEPVNKRPFWLSKAIEPTTGRMMIYLQFGFPTGNGDVNNIPKPVYDTDHWDFEMGCYKYIPKVRPTPEFNGLLGFKATDGHWKVAEVDINAFYRV